MDTEIEFSPIEYMAYRAALEFKPEDVVFAGIGIPVLASNLARATHAPDHVTIFECGVIGAQPTRAPISIADPTVVAGCLSVCTVGEVFQHYLQGGLIDLGLIGGGQIDRFGNINSTVIGSYENPKERWPGSGGACEIATHAKRVIVVMPISPKSFVAQCDFITTPGHYYFPRGASQTDKSQLMPSNKNLYRVITNMGVFGFKDGEMELIEVCPGFEAEEIKGICNWDLKVSDNLLKPSTPPRELLELLRQKIDPDGIYL